MSGYSCTFLTLNVGRLKLLLDKVPDDLKIQVPSFHRPGEFVDADHVFVDSKEGYVSLDGDISGYVPSGTIIEGEANEQ